LLQTGSFGRVCTKQSLIMCENNLNSRLASCKLYLNGGSYDLIYGTVFHKKGES